MYDALVIGAGPSGSTAARLLARAGWSVAIVEKSNFPRGKVCGEFISATSLPLLNDEAVKSAFLSCAGPEVRRVGLFARDTQLTSPMPPAHSSIGSWGRALGREHLDLILLEAASHAGVDVIQRAKVTALRRVGVNFNCAIAGDNASCDLTARIVIAANGSWERGPLQVERTYESKASDLLAFKAHFRNCDLAPDLMPLLVFPGGYGGMVHSDRGRVSLSCCIRRDMLEKCRRADGQMRAAESVLSHIKSSCAGVAWALAGARIEGGHFSAGPIRPGIRRRYADGIFFVGNAAGEAHPIIAEGISMAMQSAWLLSQSLLACQQGSASAATIAEAGRTYSGAWKNAFGPRIRAAGALAQLAMQPGIATLAIKIVKQFPALLTWGARLSGKTTQLIEAREC